MINISRTYNLFYNAVGTTPLVLFWVGCPVHVCSLLFGEWKFDLYDPYLANFPFHYCKVSLMACNLLPAVHSHCNITVANACEAWQHAVSPWQKVHRSSADIYKRPCKKSLFRSMVLRRQIHFCYCSSLCGNYRHGMLHRGACICLWIFIATS